MIKCFTAMCLNASPNPAKQITYLPTDSTAVLRIGTGADCNEYSNRK